MPGFSFDPLSALSFSQPQLEELTVPFTPDLRHQHGLDVSCIPYSISPVPLLEIAKSSTLSRTELVDSITLDYRSLDFSMFAAYPVLLPVYLMRYDWKIQAMTETISLTCMLQAHSKNGLAYFDNGDNQTRNILRKTFDEMPGSFLQKLSPPANETSPWDVIYGTEYGFSSVGIPNVHFNLDSFNKGLSEGLDKRMHSKSDMDALASYGVGMEHPCVRPYTKEEVDANRKFLVASGACYAMRESFKSVTPERIRNGQVQFASISGKRIADPEAIYENLKKKKLALEKQKDDLLPQWVQDWRESQRQGKST